MIIYFSGYNIQAGRKMPDNDTLMNQTKKAQKHLTK